MDALCRLKANLPPQFAQDLFEVIKEYDFDIDRHIKTILKRDREIDALRAHVAELERQRKTDFDDGWIAGWDDTHEKLRAIMAICGYFSLMRGPDAWVAHAGRERVFWMNKPNSIFPDAIPLYAGSAPAPAVDTRLTDMEARKDAAYFERNQVVAALAKCFPSIVTQTEIPGWSSDWHGCVYIQLPTGQVSWHFHESQMYLLDGIPVKGAGWDGWDGHDTEEKYRRLNALPVPAAQMDNPDVMARATAYARDIVTWLHRDHYADNTRFEPFDDLLGLLSQIDNMVCGWKELSVAAICNAYESGVGHRGRPTANVNPYRECTPEHEAYAIGAGGTDSCRHGIRYPHPCRECEESVPGSISVCEACRGHGCSQCENGFVMLAAKAKGE